MPKVKDKERILKAERAKQLPTKEFPYDCQLISQKKLCRQEVFKVIQSKDLQPRLFYPAKLSLNRRADKVQDKVQDYPRQDKVLPIKIKCSTSPSHYYKKY